MAVACELQTDRFKVTDSDTNRKPICHFLLVNNANLHHISYRFQVLKQY